jgi:hypothetical protein
MTARVYKLRRLSLPAELVPLLERLTKSARVGRLTGIAFVALLDDHGYLADSFGEANDDLAQTRLLLEALDLKLARRQLAAEY